MEDKYIKEMEEIYEKYENDNELLHVKCDNVLVRFLEDLGYTKIVELYDKLEDYFWYA